MSAAVSGETVRWGGAPVDPSEPNLPALKGAYLLRHVPRRGTVVEIGCGEGKWLRLLAAHAPELELFGADVQPPSDPRGFAYLPLSDGTVALDAARADAVVLFDVLEHVDEPPALIAEARRLLKPGGHLVAFVPIEGEKWSAYELYRLLLGADTYRLTKEHVQAFTHDDLDRLIGEGFSLVDRTFAYHPIGHALDATFFAAARLDRIRRFWWQENEYYRGKGSSDAGLLPKALNLAMKAANALAFYESTALSRRRFGAAGQLVTLVKR